MKRSEIITQLELIFRQIAPEIDFKKLDLAKPLAGQTELDSFDIYNILVKTEQSLGVRVPESLLRQTPHLNGLIDYLEATSEKKN